MGFLEYLGAGVVKCRCLGWSVRGFLEVVQRVR